MKSGFVAILGRPNAGKSTLLNALDGREGGHCLGQAADYAEPHRRGGGGCTKKGVHGAAQIVFVDTPGVHKPGSHLDRRMLQEVYEALETRDLVLVLMDATRRVQLEEVGGNVSDGDAMRDPWSPTARDQGHPVLNC